MADPAIIVENLGKRYTLGQRSSGSYRTLRDSLAGLLNQDSGIKNQESKDFWALKDVSFEIKRGEVVGIIGRNGAGKSTLLKVLSRITEPTTGRVTLDGRVASLLEVGTGFHPELSGRENIFLNGAILGMRRTEILARFDEIVAFAEIEEFLDTPVKRYSSGMYVRLAFAVASHLQPEILVVDEVLAVGDVAFQRKCLQRMGEVSRQGLTILLVSHHMPSIRRLCQSAILLESGRVAAFSDDVEAVVQRYLGAGEEGPNSLPPKRQLRGVERDRGEDVILESITLRKAGAEAAVFEPGEDMEACVQLDTRGQSYEHLEISVFISSSAGDRVATCFFRQASDEFLPERGAFVCFCVLPSLWLGAGDYWLGIGVSNKNMALDKVSCAIQFRVLSHAVSSAGYLQVPARWRVER